MDPLYSLSGFITGAIVGLTGVGGGSLMTPLLVLAFGVAPAVAVGTDLLFAAVTKAGGAWVHQSNGTVDWRITGYLAAGSLPAAGVALAWMHAYGGGMAATSVIKTALGIALILTALALILKPWLVRWRMRNADLSAVPNAKREAVLTIVTGVVIGALVALSSIGAGAVGMVALTMLYPRMAPVRLVGTDIAHAVPLTLVAGIGHALLGNVDWGLLGLLLVGSLPGIYLGSRVAHRLPENWLRAVLATVLLVIGGRFVW